jgi:hypothetical protein
MSKFFVKTGQFFINTGDGFEFADTEEEARKVATEAIEFWRQDAIDSGEWDSEVSSVYWGKIHERAKEIVLETREDSDKCDYQLRPVE